MALSSKKGASGISSSLPFVLSSVMQAAGVSLAGRLTDSFGWDGGYWACTTSSEADPSVMVPLPLDSDWPEYRMCHVPPR